MPIINQTASITNVSGNFGLVVMMLVAGGVIVVIVWFATQLRRG
jgi:hypothetical protein